MDYKAPSEECSNGCGRQRRKGQRTCSECHRKYMRQWRRERKQDAERMARALFQAGVRMPV